MVDLQFWGAAQTVTGSMHLLTTAARERLLLDCGLYQGRRELAEQVNRNFPFAPSSISAVVLSHAHIDHTGNLPQLVGQGFSGPVYTTPATRDLAGIMLRDSAHIQVSDAQWINKRRAREGQSPISPLYNEADAVATLEAIQSIGYGRPFPVADGVKVTYFDAGHILGSAGLVIEMKDGDHKIRVGFSGDVGRWNMPILRDPTPLPPVDYLLLESTYGGKTHPPIESAKGELADVIRRTAERGGKVIIPAFSVGRTQELLYMMRQLQDDGLLPKIPVFVDSPLAIDATTVFRLHPECFDAETMGYIEGSHGPFDFDGLRFTRHADDSKKINDLAGPAVIIAASGMAEAGRIRHHLANHIGDPNSTILIVGFQAEHTLGRRLVEKDAQVNIFGQRYQRKAEVVVINSLSAHADQPELLRYLGNQDPATLKGIFLVHGEIDRQEKLASALKSAGFSHVEIPERGQAFTLGADRYTDHGVPAADEKLAAMLAEAPPPTATGAERGE